MDKELKKNENKLEDRLISIYEKALQIDPEDKLLFIDLGNLYEEKKMYKKAIELYERAIELGADESLINHFLVRVYEEEELYDKAVAIYEKMLAKDPYNIIAAESLSRLYLKIKRPNIERAKYMMEKSRDISFVSDLRRMAEEKEKRSLYDSAIEIYEQIVKIDPNYYLAYNKLAKIYRIKGDINKAIRLYEKGVKTNKENFIACLWLGILYALKIEKKKAVAKLKKVVNNRLSGSLRIIAESIQNYVKSEAYHNSNQMDKVAELRKKEKEIERAMYKYEEILINNKEDWLSHFYLGIIYFIKDLYDKSRSEFRELLRINPQSPEAKLISTLKDDIIVLEE